MAEVIGNECWLGVYYSDTQAALTGAESFTKVAKVREGSLDMSGDEIRFTHRDSGWEGARVGMMSAGGSFDMIRDMDETTWQNLRDCYREGHFCGLKVLDGANGDGFWGTAYITGFSDGEPLSDVATTSVTFVFDGTPTVVS